MHSLIVPTGSRREISRGSQPAIGNKGRRDERKSRRQSETNNDGAIESKKGRRSGCRPEVAGAGAFTDSVYLQSDTVTAVVQQASENANISQ